jgi:hypothetical protein
LSTSPSPSPFHFNYFSDRVSCFCLGWPWTYLCLLSSWDHRRLAPAELLEWMSQ